MRRRARYSSGGRNALAEQIDGSGSEGDEESQR